MFHKFSVVKNLLTILVMGLMFQVASGQEVAGRHAEVTGQVLDEEGRALNHVIVNSKQSRGAVTTDDQGKFSIAVSLPAVLEFAHSRFENRQLVTNSNKPVVIKLRKHFFESAIGGDSAQPLMVDVLYGRMRSDKIIGSVSTVYNKQIATTPASNYLYALPGRLAGLNVNQTSGFYSALTSPLTDVDIFVGNIPKNNSGAGPTDNTEFNVQLRGHAASAGQSPLTLIDGVQRDFFSLDPENIESISILKDALSTILLGQQSSRGALIVTTKNPSQGAPKLSFTAERATQEALGLPTPLRAYQYAYLMNEALLNDGRTAAYTVADFEAYKNGTDPMGHPDVNWYNTALRNNPLLTRYNLSVNGGGTMARYIVSLSYLDQDGFYKTNSQNSYNTNLELKRYLINSKVDVDVNKYFNIQLQLFGRLQQGNQPGAGSSNILNAMLNTPSNAYPVMNPDGTYGGNSNYRNNLWSMVQNSGYLNDNTRDVMANLDMLYRFDRWIPGLWVKAKGNVSVQSSSLINRSKQAPVFTMVVSSAGDTSYNRYGNIVNQQNSFTSTSWARYVYSQVSLGYDKQVGKNSINAMLMADSKSTLLNYDIPSQLTNFAGKVSVDHNEKYLAEVALNYSGYNRYQPGKQYGLFYAGGVAWNIAKEDFIKESLPSVNMLKLRATYGRTGNANIDHYGYYVYRTYFQDVAGTYGMGNTYPNSGGLAEAGNPGNQVLANVNATWEKADKLNVGLDVALFKNKFQLTADYYHEKYFDVLQRRGKTIELVGMGYPAENIGENLYTGTELTLTYQNNYRDFNYFISANASRQSSEVLFMDEQFQQYEWNKQTGHPVGQRYGLVVDGFFQTQQEADEGATIVGYEPHVGDFKYRDLNEDGVINQFDVTAIGAQRPMVYYGVTAGFSFKGFAVSALLQGVTNREIYVNNGYLIAGFQSQNNGFSQAYESSLGRWTPENAATAIYPRLTAGGSGYNYNPMFTSNSYFIRNGNYFRLKNVHVEYELPFSMVSKFKLAGLKLFANAMNLYTFAAYDMADPEVSMPSYPMQKVVNVGVNIKL